MSVSMRYEVEEMPTEAYYAPAYSVRARSAPRPVCNSRLVTLICVMLALAAALALTPGLYALSNVSHSVLRPVKAAPSIGRVSVGPSAVSRSLGFVTVTGTVINRSKTPLHNVEAVIELLGSRGETVGEESAPVAFDPIVVGDSTPYKVQLQDSAAATGYRVRVREIMGGRLD